MDIPIRISIRGNPAELQRDLLGVSNVLADERIRKLTGERNLREANQSATISDGITIKHVPVRRQSTESVESGFVDWHAIVTIADSILNLGMHSNIIANWFLDRIQNQNDWRITIDGTESTTRDELQHTLDEYMNSHSD